jgi:hypothetical protein
MGKKFIVRPDVPKEPALIIKNQLLLSPGKWKGQTISRESIVKGMENTDWKDGKSNSVIYGHRTNTSNTYLGDPSPDMWVGYHSEPKYLTLSDGVEVEGMYADYHIYDTELASKLAYGGVRAGVSEGMEYDYYTGTIHRFINSSIVNDPACKNAFLNLSENDEPNGMELSEPRFLNLAEDKKEDKPEEDKKEDSESHTVERGSNGKDMTNNDMEDKMKAFEEKVSKVESTLEEISNKLSEKKEDEKPKEEPEVKPSEDKPEEPEKTPEPPKEDKKEPVVIESSKPKEDDSKKNDNTEVVDAINKMGDRIVDGVKKAAEPQTAAQTNPNAVQSDMDDEKVTEQLVEQYSKLHPETSQNE